MKTHTSKKLSPGFSDPQGATLNQDGVNFSLYSKYADEIFLLLFDKESENPTDIIKVSQKTGHIWHVFVHGLKAGQLYAYKANGKFDPKNGYRFNPHKCLIDPYAKAVTGKYSHENGGNYSYQKNSPKKDLSFDSQDNTLHTPKSIVIDNTFDWQNDRSPKIPPEKLIIYEVHLKGFTAHSSATVSAPGTYLGFIEKIPHLKELGINSVELLPVHEFYSNEFLTEKGLTNYWGYNTIGFFAPEISYSSQTYPGCQVNEFKTLVRELHKAGIEVILDVVYNHTGEQNELGPTINFRGIDNQTYYGLQGEKNQPYRYYRNNAGTGNILNVENPQVQKLILDSLRYWVEEMHVDGFRFDLATILGYENGVFSKNNAFFRAVARDPVLKNVKLIAEPWDITTYQTGNFPKMWAEWNDKFRDTVRRFLRGDTGQLSELALRISGSSDIFKDGKPPFKSINFITCHDGFTLYDLYSYKKKHNLKNGEDNRDGSDNNFSWNCGTEGIAKNPDIVRLRKQMVKNAICCLLFSVGTPMILGGDEFLRTQQGNNNSYCQDNEINWFDWSLLQKNRDILEFFKKAIRCRKKYELFQKTNEHHFLNGDGKNTPLFKWFNPCCENPDDNNYHEKLFCYQIQTTKQTPRLDKYIFLFILNADNQIHNVKIPEAASKIWYRIVDTSFDAGEDFLTESNEVLLDPIISYQSKPKSFVILSGVEKQVDSSYYLG